MSEQLSISHTNIAAPSGELFLPSIVPELNLTKDININDRDLVQFLDPSFDISSLPTNPSIPTFQGDSDETNVFILADTDSMPHDMREEDVDREIIHFLEGNQKPSDTISGTSPKTKAKYFRTEPIDPEQPNIRLPLPVGKVLEIAQREKTAVTVPIPQPERKTRLDRLRGRVKRTFGHKDAALHILPASAVTKQSPSTPVENAAVAFTYGDNIPSMITGHEAYDGEKLDASASTLAAAARLSPIEVILFEPYTQELAGEPAYFAAD